jgi:hypothetical protein
MYEYDGIMFTEEDIEKMALEYIELTKEAGLNINSQKLGQDLAPYILSFFRVGGMNPEFDSFIKNYLNTELTAAQQNKGVTINKQLVPINKAKDYLFNMFVQDFTVAPKPLVMQSAEIRSDPNKYQEYINFITNYKPQFMTMYNEIASGFQQ